MKTNDKEPRLEFLSNDIHDSSNPPTSTLLGHPIHSALDQPGIVVDHLTKESAIIVPVPYSKRLR